MKTAYKNSTNKRKLALCAKAIKEGRKERAIELLKQLPEKVREKQEFRTVVQTIQNQILDRQDLDLVDAAKNVLEPTMLELHWLLLQNLEQLFIHELKKQKPNETQRARLACEAIIQNRMQCLRALQKTGMTYPEIIKAGQINENEVDEKLIKFYDRSKNAYKIRGTQTSRFAAPYGLGKAGIEKELKNPNPITHPMECAVRVNNLELVKEIWDAGVGHNLKHLALLAITVYKNNSLQWLLEHGNEPQTALGTAIEDQNKNAILTCLPFATSQSMEEAKEIADKTRIFCPEETAFWLTKQIKTHYTNVPTYFQQLKLGLGNR